MSKLDPMKRVHPKIAKIMQEDEGTTGGSNEAFQPSDLQVGKQEALNGLLNKKHVKTITSVSGELTAAKTTLFFQAFLPLLEEEIARRVRKNASDAAFAAAEKAASETLQTKAPSENSMKREENIGNQHQILNRTFTQNQPLKREVDDQASLHGKEEVARKLHAAAQAWQLRETLLESIEKNKNSLKTAITVINGVMQPIIFPVYWLMSSGILAAIISQSTFITFSILANYFSVTDKNEFKAFVAFIWPYCTETMRSLEIVCEGIEKLEEMLESLGAPEITLLSSLLLPLVLLNITGGIFLRRIEERRAAVEEDLKESLKKIKAATTRDALEKLETLVKEALEQQDASNTNLTYLTVIYTSFFENLEHLNALFFLALNPPAFIVTLAFTSVYMAFGIVKAVYEQYEGQESLKIEAAKVNLLYLGKQLMLLQDEQDGLEDKQVTLDELRFNIYKECQVIKMLSQVSYWSCAMSGIKQGISVYGALFATMSAAISFLSMASITVSPVVFVAGLGFSLVLLAGSIVQALLEKGRREAALKAQSLILDEKLVALQSSNSTDPILLQEIMDLTGDLSGIGLKEATVEGWSTVVESFFLGIQSGSDASEEEGVDMTLSSIIKHCAPLGNSLPASIIGGVCSIIYAVILSIKSFYGAFGKEEKEDLKMMTSLLALQSGNKQENKRNVDSFNEHEKDNADTIRVNAALNKFTLCNKTHSTHEPESRSSAPSGMQKSSANNTPLGQDQCSAAGGHLTLIPQGNSSGCIFQHKSDDQLAQVIKKEREDEDEGDGEVCSFSQH